MNSVYEIVTESIIAQLEKGVVPWQTPWATGFPRSVVTGTPYRGFNAFVLGMAGENSETPFWCTFNQAQEMGGNVRRGEHSVPITFWKELGVAKKGQVKDEDIDEKSNRPRLMCRYYRVFNADQIEWTKGEPKRLQEWRESERLRASGEKVEPVEQAEKIVREMLDAPKITHQGNSAFYVPEKDYIQLPPREDFLSVEGYYGTLFHELTHATGHPSRLGRFDEAFSPSREQYSKEELVAELGACFLCQHAGIDPDIQQSASYIDGWRKAIKDDPRIILSAAAAAQRSSEHVLGISPERARAMDKSPAQEISAITQIVPVIEVPQEKAPMPDRETPSHEMVAEK